MSPADDSAQQRALMVARQLEARGIRDPRVLAAMRRVPRHRFVPDRLLDAAYDDGPLPIGEGQTISQPYMVAMMSEALRLRGDERVLEVGTGSGYQAAVLAELAAEVVSVERHRELAAPAAVLLAELGYDNAAVEIGDGTLGWPPAAPYGGILVTAGAPAVPDALRRQLVIGGRLVIPIGDRLSQAIEIHRRTGDDAWQVERSTACRFVRLIGEQGWPP